MTAVTGPFKPCKLIMDGMPGSLNSTVWRCACGRWNGGVTKPVGPYGRTSNKARISQMKMGYDKHVRHAKP